MCGRYTSITPAAVLARFFRVDEVVAEELGARYNVAPTQEVYAVARHGATTRLGSLRWGLIPPWAEDARVGARMINARAESVADRPAFRQAFAVRRCLIPADGFYEWQAASGTASRAPWYIRHRDGQPLALAGLWESWRPPRSDGDRIVTATIVTTTANDALADLHDRMPVVVAPASWETWLDPCNHDVGALAHLLTPAPSELFERSAVRPLVNHVANEGPELVAPAEGGTSTGARA